MSCGHGRFRDRADRAIGLNYCLALLAALAGAAAGAAAEAAFEAAAAGAEAAGADAAGAAGAEAAGASSFLPQAARATAAIIEANRMDFFMCFLKASEQSNGQWKSGNSGMELNHEPSSRKGHIKFRDEV